MYIPAQPFVLHTFNVYIIIMSPHNSFITIIASYMNEVLSCDTVVYLYFDVKLLNDHLENPKYCVLS